MDSLEGRARHPHDSLSVNVFGVALTVWLLLGVAFLWQFEARSVVPEVPHPDDLTDPRIAIEHEMDGGRSDVAKLMDAVEAARPNWDQRRQLRLYEWEQQQAAVEQAHAEEKASFVRWRGGLLGGTGLLVLLAGIWVYGTRPVRYRLTRRYLELGEHRFVIENEGGLQLALQKLEWYRVDPELREAVQHAHDVLGDAEPPSEEQQRALASLAALRS